MFTKDFTVHSVLSLTAKRGNLGPDIRLEKASLPEGLTEGGEFTARIAIANRGDTAALIDKVDLNLGNYEVIYQPQRLEPGQTGDILVKFVAEDKGLKVGVSSISEELGCPGIRESFSSFDVQLKLAQIQACTQDSNCAAGEACCLGRCRPRIGGVCDDIDGDGEMDIWISK